MTLFVFDNVAVVNVVTDYGQVVNGEALRRQQQIGKSPEIFTDS